MIQTQTPFPYLVSAAVAVVGCREDGDNIPVVGPVVPLHHKLVCPGGGWIGAQLGQVIQICLLM